MSAFDELDPKTKYILEYAKDVTKPPGKSPTETVQFRSWFRFMFFAVTDKEARTALLADRCRLITIVKPTKSK